MKLHIQRLQIAGLLCFIAGAGPLAKADDDGLSEVARKNLTAQIQALHQEKNNRTPAQKKMDSQLVHAAKEHRKEAIAPGTPKFKSGVKVDPDGSVLVDLRATVTPQLLKAIEKRGGQILNSFAEYEAIQARVPVDELEFLAGQPDVSFIKTASEPDTHAISQGDRTHRADFVRNSKNVFGTSTRITGQGVKVGVLSDSVDYLSNAQASNTKGRGTDLGPVTIINNAAGTQQHGRPATGEGTAMLEIVYDLAPGAQLFFATGNGGKANMANNIKRLRSVYGCDIIIDDLTYSDESPFQDDELGQAVHTVSDSGALYFSSAANSGNQNDGTSATWEGDYNGGNFIPGVGTWHRWSGTNTFNRYTQSGTNGTRIGLFWPDKLGKSSNDYDLYVFDNAGNVLASSTNPQTGSQDPYEWVGGVTSGLNIAVLMVNASGRYLHLDAGRGQLQFGTSGDTRGHNASIAGNAFCVAATPVSRSPAPGVFTGGANNPVETFSSDGLRLRFYDRYTNAYTPGNFSSTGGFTFQKPDITAADGVANSGVYPASVNLSPFSGTSAAAPHAGAIAALLKSYNTNLTDVQIRQALLETALDIEAAGTDRDSGFGIIMADRALAAVQPTILRSTSALSFSVAQGAGNPAPQSFTIRNTGFTKLNWTVASSASWLTLNPTSGDATKGIDTDTVTVSVNTSSLSVGLHTAIISITDPEASNSAQAIGVYLTISDTTSPTLRITAPLNNSSHQIVPSLAGVASDGGGSGIQNNRVEFTLYSEGDFWTGSQWKSNTDAQDPAVRLFAPLVNGTWAYTNVPAGANARVGTYFVSAFVRDISGNLSAPQPGITSISFKVDRDPPQVTITSPLDHAIISNFTAIAGTASDSVGLLGVNLYLYRFADGQFWDGSAWGGGGSAILPVTIYSGSGNWNSAGPLPILGGGNPNTAFLNGDYNVIAIAYDGAGNERRADSVFTVDYHPISTWTAGSFSDSDPNNNNQNWDNPANWNPYGVPTAEARIIINGGDPTSRHLGFVKVHRLELNGGTLWAPNMNIKYLDFTGGTFLPTGSVQIADSGTFNWTGGLLGTGDDNAPKGIFNVPTTGVLNISGGGAKYSYNVTLNNSGTVNWTGGNVYGHHAFYNNGPTGVWTEQADATLNLWPGFGDGFRTFANWGTFRKTGGADSWHQGSFTNYGTVEIQTGHFNIYDSLSLENGSQITGAGSVRVVNGCCGLNVNVPGTATISGGLEMLEGNTHVRGSGTLYVASGGRFVIGEGWVGGNVTLAGPGNFLWTGSGGFDGNNLIAASATVSVSGPATKNMAAGSVLRNAGTINWSGPGAIYNYAYYLEQRATITNLSGAAFNLLADGQVFSHSYNYPLFYNEPGAHFGKTGGAGITTVNSFDFQNRGELFGNTGTLQFDDVLNLNDGGTLTGAGLMLMPNGSTALRGTTTINGPTFQMSGGTLTGDSTNATFRTLASGAFEWSGGTINGMVNFTSNSLVRISSNAVKTMGAGAIINNAGNLTWSDAGDVYNYAYYLDTRATFNNLPGASFIVTGNAGFTYSYNPPTFNNFANALFRKSAGVDESIMHWLFNNDGTAEALTGRLTFNNGGSSSGTFRSSGAALLRFNGGRQTLQNGARLAGLGTHQITGGTVTLNGTVTLGEGAAANTLEIITGALDGTGALFGPGIMHWSGGTIGGTIELGPIITVNVDGPDTKSLGGGAVLNNRGTVNWSGTGPIYNYAYYEWDRATFNNLNNATFNVLGDGQVFANSYNRSFFNNQAGARFSKAGGSGTSTINTFIFSNNGELRCLIGTLEFTDTLNLNAGTTLSGGGLIRWAGDVVASASIPSSCHVRLAGGGFRGTVDNLGTSLATYTGSGLFDWTGGTINGQLSLASGSVMNVSGPEAKVLGDGAILKNSGTVNWNGAGRIYNYAYYESQRAAISNLAGGTFNLLADGEVFEHSYNLPSFYNQSGALLSKTFSPGVTTLNHFAIHNRGQINVGLGTLQCNDTLNLYPGNTLTGPGRLLIPNGTTTLFGTTTVNGPVLEMTGGSLNSDPTTPGTIQTAGASFFEWSGGTINGALTFAAGGQMRITGAATKVFGDGATLNNHGTVTWSDAGAIYNYAYYLSQRATINNRTGATWLATGDGAFVSSYNAPTFNNAAGATFRKSGGTGTTTCDWIFAQDGTLALVTGNLALNSTFTPSAASTLRVTLSGITPLTQHPRLTLAQPATLTGSLTVLLGNGFVPTNNQSFNLVAYPSRTGQFNAPSLPMLTGALVWQPDYGANLFSLRVAMPHLLSAASKVENGNFQMNFSGPPASAAIFQATADFLYWESLATNAPFSGTFLFSDGQAPMHSNRFYRILIVP